MFQFSARLSYLHSPYSGAIHVQSLSWLIYTVEVFLCCWKDHPLFSCQSAPLCCARLLSPVWCIESARERAAFAIFITLRIVNKDALWLRSPGAIPTSWVDKSHWLTYYIGSYVKASKDVIKGCTPC
jgi:hypothetical protein